MVPGCHHHHFLAIRISLINLSSALSSNLHPHSTNSNSNYHIVFHLHSQSLCSPSASSFTKRRLVLEFIHPIELFLLLVYISTRIVARHEILRPFIFLSVHITWVSQLYRTVHHPAIPTGVVSAIFIFIPILLPDNLRCSRLACIFCLLITLFSLPLFPYLGFQTNQ